nr:DUF3095 family protein [Thiomicrorhabdus aquaedulcis]
MSDFFEQSIPIFTMLEATLDVNAYVAVPADWVVIVTDIKNSTLAIQEGRYRDVNAVGGSTIAALTNALKPLAAPFVFGGDGATFCVPPTALPQIKKALRGCQELARDGLKLELRVGLVPVSDLTKKVLVCRYARTVNMTQYFFMGGA